eukprot:14642266-Alexandrium_andersonii.AAC.1
MATSTSLVDSPPRSSKLWSDGAFGMNFEHGNYPSKPANRYELHVESGNLCSELLLHQLGELGGTQN